MKFERANINGQVAQTQLYSKPHRFGILASHTATTYSQPLYLKAASDSAMQKTEPVTFLGRLSGTTATVTLATASFVTTVEAYAVVDELATGTWFIWATWPGEGIYSSATTFANQLTHVVRAGVGIGGTTVLTSTPPSGTLVRNEGTATFTATMTTSTVIPGSHNWFVNGLQVASVPIEDNRSTLQLSNLGTGTNTIRVTWPGGEIGGTQYGSQSATTSYVIRRGTTATATVSLSINPPNYGILQEGNVSLTAVLNTATILPGNFKFYKNNALVYTGPLSNNSTTYTFANVDAVGTYTFHALWDGNQNSNPRYIEIQSSTSTWTVKARETIPSMTLTIDPLKSDFSLPVDFTAVLNTSTQINTGTVSFVVGSDVIATVPVTSSTVEFTTFSLSTGTFQAYAYYSGSLNTPKYYPVTSNTLTMTVTEGVSIGATLRLEALSDSYVGTGAPYVKGETVTLQATLPTAIEVDDYVRFRNLNNYSTIGFADFVFTGTNNTATTTTVFTSSGTYQLQAIWDGAQIGAVFYAGQTSATSITVVDGYTMPSPLVLTASQPRVIDENIVFTATVTTSSVMANTVTFYANTLTLGTAQFNTLTNKAELTTAIANSGTYTIQAIWSGGLIDGGRPYLPLASSTSSMFVDYAADFLYPLTLAVNSLTNSVGSSTVLTAVINTTTLLTGTGAGSVTFKENTYNRTLGTGTITSNVATVTVPGDTFTTASNYTYRAEWSGSTATPKFKAKSTNTTATLVARSIAYPTLDILDFYRNELDGVSTKFVQTATVRVTGTYITHQPTGSVELYDGAQLINTATITNGIAEFSWLPTAFNQLDSGTRSISAVYLRDSWNNTATTTSTWIARTRRPTSINMYMGSTATFRPTQPVIYIEATSTYFNSKLVDIYEGGSVIGQTYFVGSTASYVLNTNLVSLGSHSYSAKFEQDWAYSTATSNTLTFTVSKGNLPITLAIDTSTLSVGFVGDRYEVRRPETVKFQVRSSSSYARPVTIEFRQGNVFKYGWFTATHIGTYTEISTSSSYINISQEVYDVRVIEDDTYSTTASNGIIVDVEFIQPSPVTLTMPTTLIRPDNFIVTLSSTGTYWIGKSMTLFAGTATVGTMTFVTNVITGTFNANNIALGTANFYATHGDNISYLATSTNIVSVTTEKRSADLVLYGPISPEATLLYNPATGATQVNNNNFYISANTPMIFTATSTGTFYENQNMQLQVYLTGTNTLYYSNATFNSGKVEFTLNSGNTSTWATPVPPFFAERNNFVRIIYTGTSVNADNTAVTYLSINTLQEFPYWPVQINQ